MKAKKKKNKKKGKGTCPVRQSKGSKSKYGNWKLDRLKKNKGDKPSDF